MKNHLSHTTASPSTYTAGRCIYCMDVNTTDLSREHVVPRALGGGLIIHEASCAPHQKIINEEIETPILSHFLGPFRQAHGMRNSPPSSRQIPVEVESIGKPARTVLVPVADYPELLAMPYSDRLPGLLTGADACPAVWEQTFFAHNPESIARLGKKLGGSIRLRGKVSNAAFARFLAKVAHGVAISHFDFDFTPTLINLIEGRDVDRAGLHVGIDPEPPAPASTGRSHTLKTRVARTEKEWLIIISVRLFATIGAPSYAVIAGTFPDGTHPDWERGTPQLPPQHK